MRLILSISLLLCLLTQVVIAQLAPTNSGQNYIITQTPRTPQTTVSTGSAYPTTPATVQYFDGLGRPTQTNQVRGAGNASTDIITETSTYDAFGRPQTTILPIPSFGAGGGLLVTSPSSATPAPTPITPLSTATAFYSDTYPYTETVYETSPLNRPTQQWGPGQNWRTANRSTTTRYGVGAGVIRFQANSIAIFFSSTTQKPVDYFGRNDISTQTTINEQLQTTIAYTDLQGRIIRRDVVLNPGDTLTTAYVYDNFERLTAVIPPKLYRWFTPSNTVLLFRTGDVFSGPDNPVFKQSAYVYLHDKRGRQIAKHVPNAGWTEMIYDRQDRLVMSRDQQDNADGQWRFTKYDGLGRTVMSGRTSLPLGSTQTADTLRNRFAALTVTNEDRATGAGTLLGYTQRSFPASVPISASAVLVVNYYDNYAASTLAYQSPGSPFVAPYSSAATGNATGLLTGTLTRILSNSGIVGNTAPNVGAFYQATFWYDDKNRVLQAQSQNHLGGTDRTDNQYSFNGELQQTAYRHQPGAGASTTTVTTTYTHDHLGRLIQLSHAVGPRSPTSLATYSYDAIGRLAGKTLGGGVPATSQQTGSWPLGSTWQGNAVPGASNGVTLSAGHIVSIPASNTVGAVKLVFGPGSKLVFGPGGGGRLQLGLGGGALQLLTYQYHIRGWLRGVNINVNGDAVLSSSRAFSMRLDYETGGRYDGSIGGQVWVHNRVPRLGHSYRYLYDNASRLTSAGYTSNPGGSTDLSVTNISYDPNGNLLTMNRAGVDQLTYTYSPVGNSLTAVTDAITGNANVGDFRNPTSGSGPVYDYWPDGSLKFDRSRNLNEIRYNLLKLPREIIANGGTKIVSYTYSATGQKLRMSVAGEIRDYIGPFEYVNGVLSEIHTDEGRYTPAGGYEYFVRDHLGNVRSVIGSSGITQYSDYDPWGWQLPSLTGGSSSNRLKYNGKEAVGELGANVFDYGARLYDAQIGRMKNPDALAEAFSEVSPYSYGLNNPMYYVDPTGDSTVPAARLNMSEKTFNTQQDVVMLDAVTVRAQKSNVSQQYSTYSDESGNRVNRDGSAYVSTNPRDIMMGPIVMSGSSEDDNTIDALFAFFSPAKYLQGLALFAKINPVSKMAAVANLVAKSGETSATKLGKSMHKAYKSADVEPGVRVKEFTLPSGKRMDFIDFQKKVIYELKPNNTRAARMGVKQLNQYKKEVESIYGPGFSTVLDKY